MEALEDGSLTSKVFLIKNNLLKNCIQSFLLKEKRKLSSVFFDNNEIHVFNYLYNSFCSSLGIPKIEDPLAPSNFSKKFLSDFLDQASLDISDLKVYYQLSLDFFEMLREFLSKLNILSFLDTTVKLEDFNDLEECFITPVNMLFNLSRKENRLMLSTLLDENEKLNRKVNEWVSLKDSFAKLLIFVFSILYPSRRKSNFIYPY